MPDVILMELRVTCGVSGVFPGGAVRVFGTKEIVAKKITISAKNKSAYIQPAFSVTSSPNPETGAWDLLMPYFSLPNFFTSFASSFDVLAISFDVAKRLRTEAATFALTTSGVALF
jgi:hypothetical protein